MATKRRRKRSRRNPSTGATVGISVAVGLLGGVAGFWLASLGCARMIQQIAEDPNRYFPQA